MGELEVVVCEGDWVLEQCSVVGLSDYNSGVGDGDIWSAVVEFSGAQGECGRGSGEVSDYQGSGYCAQLQWCPVDDALGSLVAEQIESHGGYLWQDHSCAI